MEPTESSQAGGSAEVPLPYVFFPKPNKEDLDTASTRRLAGAAGVSDAPAGCGSRGGAAAADHQAESGRSHQQLGGGKADTATESAKSERPPIMTPDERAWNERLIKSFHSRRSLIDAIILSPSGVVISTLGRQVEVKSKNMESGWWIAFSFLLLLVTNLLLFIWLIGNGFIYIRIVKPFEYNLIRDWLRATAHWELRNVTHSSTTTISLYVIRSQITFYETASKNDMEAIFMPSNMQRNWEGLTENIIYLMTELLLGRKSLTQAVRDNRIFIRMTKESRIDITPVPHCFQNYNALREIWNNLHYQCILYLLAVITQLYLAVNEVLFKRTPHFADPRDRQLTPEQMRTRITIGLEGVATLQRICFFTKLMLLMQGVIIVTFQRFLVTVKHVEFSTRSMAKRLELAGLPATSVDLCSSMVYIAVACGTLQCLAFFCCHSLAKLYSTAGSSKVPKVRLVPSQDESYVT